MHDANDANNAGCKFGGGCGASFGGALTNVSTSCEPFSNAR
jgi:hypothetical protein